MTFHALPVVYRCNTTQRTLLMIQDEEQRNTVGATIFAVLLGLATLCLVGWVMLSGGCTDATTAPATQEEATPIVAIPMAPAPVDPVAIEESTEYMKLVEERDRIAGERLEAVSKGREAEKELARLKRKFGVLEDENASREGNASKLGTAATSAAALKIQADAAAARADALEGEIGTLKARITALEKADATAKTSVEGLKNDLNKSVSAKNQLQSAKEELESKLAAANTQVADAKNAAKAQAELQKLIDVMSADLADAKKTATEASAAMKAKEAEMAAASTKNDNEKAKALAVQLETLRKKMGTDADAWSTEKDRLVKSSKALDEQKKRLAANVSKQQAEIERLKTLLDKKQPEAAAMASTAPSPAALDLPLLINEPSQLAPYAQPLFTTLNTIEENEASRSEIYAQLKEAGEVDPKLTIPFRSGSADVGSDYLDQIQSLTKGVEGDVQYLVVGYASTDGNAEGNRKLSSERASNVAQRIAEKLGDQGAENVQAIYFGQTTRFSDNSKTPNRVVEVWQIK